MTYWILGIVLGVGALYLLYTSPGSGCGGNCEQMVEEL